MTRTLPLLLALCLSACAAGNAKPLTVHQRIEVACVDAGTAYGVIAAINNVHTLTADQQAAVLKAKVQIDLRCKLAPGADYPYTLTDAALAELENAAVTLKAIKGAVK